VFKQAIPVLHVTNSLAAEAFYCGRLGFHKDFANRGDAADPCYMGVSRDDAQIHLSSFPGDGRAGGVVFLTVDDVDAIYADLRLTGVPIALEPTDQTWGNREMYVRDPDGNCMRFIQEGRE
jgi:uncharacterized glyoxalase superfamily protein PhnB